MPHALHRLRRTLRPVLRSPGYALTLVLTTAMGVGLTAAVLATVRAGTAYVPQSAAPAFDRALPGMTGSGWSAGVRGMAEIQHGGVVTVLWVVFGAAVLVLAGTCVNAAALVLSRVSARRHELTMRAVLGAPPARVAARAAAEAGGLAALGAALGLVLGFGGLLAMRATFPGEGAWLAGALDARTVLTAAGIPVAVALLFAGLPALAATRGNLHGQLTVGSRATPGRHEGWVRRVVTIAQLAASMALLASAGALLRSAAPEGAGATPGFDPRDTLTLTLRVPAPLAADVDARAAYLGAALAGLREVPGVRDASLAAPGAWLGLGPQDNVTSRCPVCYEAGVRTSYLTSEVRHNGLPTPVLTGGARYFSVSPGYFRALGAEVVHGREFTVRDDRRGARVALINIALARKLFPNANPVGHSLLPHGFATPAYTVVGVVADPAPGGLAETPDPMPAAYFSALQHPPRTVDVALRAAGDPLALVPAVEGALAKTAPGASLAGVGTMEEVLARHRAPAVWFARVLAALAGFAALLTAAGVYGVVAFGVARRRREIGVRMALGARRGQVVRHVVGQGLRMARTGAFLGTVLGLALGRGMQSAFQDVQPFDPAAYLAVAALLAATALLASFGPARRAARVDPMVSLQAE